MAERKQQPGSRERTTGNRDSVQRDDAAEETLPELSERGGIQRGAQTELTTESGEFANEPHDRTRDRELNRRQGGVQDVEGESQGGGETPAA